MGQLPLLDVSAGARPLETSIERDGQWLKIPEGLQTIPCTHGMHRFPGKFIPNLPRYLIRSILGDRGRQTLCDPFCGSGTTLVEAALEGRSFVGMDIDPLAVAIARAKTHPLSEDDLILIERYWRDHHYRREKPELIPRVPSLLHWFSRETVGQLSGIKSHCLALPPRLQLFCLIVFSSIIRRVSNADDQTQKTYVSHTLPKKPPAASEIFPIFLQRAIEGMREYIRTLPRPPAGEVVRGDARTFPNLEFDDVLTSPPYIDSIDYVYNQMLEYFWLLPELGLNGYEEYRSLRKLPMGLGPVRPYRVDSFESRLSQATRGEYRIACREIRESSPKEETIVRAFFRDLSMHAEQMYERQRSGAAYICIIGNSTIRRVTIPTVDLVTDLFRNAGYKLADRMAYEIRRHYMKFPRRSNSGKIQQDHILVFQR